ncbi:Farnesyl cysteine carboxyl-methyltransferase [Alcanivorax sp. 521-1]|uniref:Farnesyl cysteine carboxyl-methyltransferase n=1 Tax=Alloalcanivorax profundimaris TaxID=2735259 RepID=A0ABS0AWC1_9GAMM|nr:isoprenylcysteine carboxylmethyltransferase family protein [Alloalcanivorax profundimaris]MAO61298.1 isoprenylcysteine carboxyl methyltransferase [Alcanivorax sp.]MAY10321.1 isoprenylcysteine carboxyl methyltransferase [Alcanivorax sp.]MBF5058441.1 Farnesyl cysteine carboxyl-methyltransferase [Alloalcanivorax profundimaris]MBI54374.1 isoprenylcysteine carboxyl methyltransferase [Alcanivorax sp.]HCE41181.1 isoprenylcysteine carboxyl methyltransferase [Alcanivorax sp.]|tara:strand:- start:30290 stop:30871 length:582 start_codon:yes stop_codon:yes gene_type:complete
MTENAAELIVVLMMIASLLLHGCDPRVAALRRPRRRGRDLEKHVLQVLVVVAMVLVPLLDALVPWFEFADFVFLDEVAWLGLLLGSASVWLLWRARRDGRPVVGDDGVLRAHGVYRYLRHPAYAAMLLWALAQLLLLQNWLAGPVAAVTFALAYLLRVPLEEQRHLERHGHRYLDYMERTGGILPRLTRHRSD